MCKVTTDVSAERQLRLLGRDLAYALETVGYNRCFSRKAIETRASSNAEDAAEDVVTTDVSAERQLRLLSPPQWQPHSVQLQLMFQPKGN